MDLFPQDVATAETLTHGNPDIIRDEEFAPEEKPSYEGLFGAEKKKKPKSIVETILKDRPTWRVKPLISKSPGAPRRPASPKTASPKVITHPRFINKALRGETDHRVCIREQPVVEDETASPSSEYRCHSCDFVTARLNVIVLHYRSHSKSTTPIPNRAKVAKVKTAKTVTRPKAETPTKASPAEPPKKRNILREPEEEPAEKSPKKSPKAATPKAATPKAATPEKAPSVQASKRKGKVEAKPEVEEKKVKKEEIQELLKDWSDEEVEEESHIPGRVSDDEDSKIDDQKEEPKKEEKKSPEKSAAPPKSKAVFDFDDDDEGLDPKLTQNSRVFGRKLPRVIDNMKERRTSFPEQDSSEPEAKNEKKRVGERKAKADKPSEVAEKTKSKSDEDVERMKELESMNAEIDSLLEKTSLPDLPEIPKLNAFSMDVTDDGLVPTKEEAKDKSILREHNNIAANATKDNEAGVATEEPSKNSLPEVGSAVEQTSTPPQADPVTITAEKAAPKPEASKSKSAVITSVILSSPQSTSGGDHSYVSEKRPPAPSQMPPLVPTSPKSAQGKSRTCIVARPAPAAGSTSRPLESAGRVKLVGVPTTSSPAKTTKPVPSLVKKDVNYVIVRTTQSGDVKVMPSLSPSSKVLSQSQPGKKLVFLTKQPSGGVILTSQRQANILSKAPPKSSAQVKVSAASVSSAQTSRKVAEAKPVGTTKKSIILTGANTKTILMPVSSSKPTTVFTRSPSSSQSGSGAQTVKLVSSKDKAGRVVLQMDSQKTRVQLPTMRRAVPQLRAPRTTTASNVTPVLASPKPKPSFDETLAALASPKNFSSLKSSWRTAPAKSPAASSSPKLSGASSPKTLTSPKTSVAVSSPKTLTTVSSPKALGAATSQSTFVAVSSPKPLTVSSSRTVAAVTSKPVTVSKATPLVASPKTLSPSSSTKSLAPPKTPPKQPTKFFHRESPRGASSAADTKATTPLKKAVAPRPQASASPSTSKAVGQTAAKAPPKAKAPEAVAGSEATQSLPAGSIVSAEGSEGAIMYILDNGTLLSYDQGTQSDGQARTVFIDPASLTSSAGDLSNLIFTFDESAGSQGALLSIAPQEGAQPEFTFAPGTQRAPGATQDILAEALANTQVLQAEASASEMLLDASSIASNTASSASALYPNNVLTLSNDVLETSLTLNAPIMTPLEVPSAVSSLQPPPVASGSLELPMTIAQPNITISTSSYASLPIPSASIQGSVFSDSTTATYSTMVPVLSGDGTKQAFFVDAAGGATFDLAEGDTPVFACAEGGTSDS